MRKKTVKINESFRCENCYRQVPMAHKTCRNHCPYCLWSLHVDGDLPGDRSSNCHGLLEPIYIEEHKKGYMIIQRCVECKAQKRNRTLDDDDWNKVIELLNMR